MKHLTLIAALMLGTTTLASAEPDASIFAAAGCDVATLVPVMKDDGSEPAYWTNTDGGGCSGYTGNDVKPTILETVERLRRESAEAEKAEMEVASN